MMDLNRVCACCQPIELLAKEGTDPQELASPRVKRLKDALDVDTYPICTEKARIMQESLARSVGWPAIIRRARAVADYLDQRTIYIAPDELIVGNVAQRPMGMEVSGIGPGWPDVDLNSLLGNGKVFLTEDHDDEHLTKYLRRGLMLSAENRSDRSTTQNAAPAPGWGLPDFSRNLHCPDYATVISTGYGAIIAQAREKLASMHYETEEDIKRADFYHACLEVFPAAIRIAHRYADEAERQAQGCADPERAAELTQIARICRRVPEFPAETFAEAIQAFYFFWLLTASINAPAGRFDQYMYPYYQADLEAGRLTRAQALELLECLRIKISELTVLTKDRKPLMAKWHNFVIGGCDRSGHDATNELTHLLIEAAFECRTPHHTLTLRVGRDTPRALIVEALRVVRTGLGLPAFINEDSYISYLTGKGVPLEDARDFALAGCMDPALPGKSRTPADGVLLVPLPVLLACFDGVDPKTGEQLGPHTGALYQHSSYESFYQAFLKQFDSVAQKTVEALNLTLLTQREQFPDVIRSAFMDRGMGLGRDYLDRTVPFENAISINMVGIMNAADALTAIKQLVFEEHAIKPKELQEALINDWEDLQALRNLCLAAPKYGNNDPAVDEVAARLWTDVSRLTSAHTSIYGAPALATGISVTSNIHGGQNTSATPDGRSLGETFADGSISPEQGKDVHGPLSMLQSAMKIPQNDFAATLMNMKLSPTSVASDEDLGKLAQAIAVYFANGGRQIQFNVVSKKTLIAAKTQRNKYRDLVVRVAGYSAYYTALTEDIQDEIIKRSEQTL